MRWRFQLIFPVLGEAAAAVPSQASVRSITHRRGRTTKPFAASERLYDSRRQTHARQALALALGGIAAVREDVRSQESGSGWPLITSGGRPVLNIGGMDQRGTTGTERVGDDVAFATLIFVSRVIA